MALHDIAGWIHSSVMQLQSYLAISRHWLEAAVLRKQASSLYTHLFIHTIVYRKSNKVDFVVQQYPVYNILNPTLGKKYQTKIDIVLLCFYTNLHPTLAKPKSIPLVCECVIWRENFVSSILQVPYPYMVTKPLNIRYVEGLHTLYSLFVIVV